MENDNSTAITHSRWRKPDVNKIKDALFDELDGSGLIQHAYGWNYIHNLFKSEFEDYELEQISEFCRTSELYNRDRRRWLAIPEYPDSNDDLHAPFSQLFKQIVDQSGLSPNYRIYLDTHNVPNIWTEDGYITPPSFMIMGVDSRNFPVTPRRQGDSTSLHSLYRRCACIGIITTVDEEIQLVETLQAAVHARQCFIEQPNRKFVYAIILTENDLRFCIFDRAGAMDSEFLDFHNSPEDFIRIVLGLCSPCDEKIGFDTTIFWKEKKRVDDVKTAEEMTMQTVDRELKERKEIEENFDQFITIYNNQFKFSGLGCTDFRETIFQVKRRIFAHRGISGRGCQCWSVFDPRDRANTLVIKDSWHYVGSNSEIRMLVEASDLPGVVQIVAYTEDYFEGTMFWRPGSLTHSQDLNRRMSRIAMEEYGPSIEQFENKLQLLCAFRDAVKGHRNLWNRGILHRDVSLNNILHGKEGSRDGYKGILIDLDMAIQINHRDFFRQSQTGTRPFLSVNVLLAFKSEYSRAHDYLDDLESFFYCIGLVCSTYNGPNKDHRYNIPVTAWEHGDTTTIARSKKLFLLSASQYLTEYFQPLSKMFARMGDFLFDQLRIKEHGTLWRLEQKTRNKMKEESQGHYDAFIGFIEDGIQDLLRGDPSRKRRGSDDVEEDCEFLHKKRRI